MPAGTKPINQPCASDHFIQTLSHKQLLAEMMQSHMVKDICLIGGKVRIAVSLQISVSLLLVVLTYLLNDCVSICRVVEKQSLLRTLQIT